MGFLSGGGFLGGAISGVTGGIFGDRAADRMGEAQHSANKLNKRQWNYIKGETAPFVSGGRNAYDKLLQSFGAQGGTWAGVAPNFDFLTQSPDYQRSEEHTSELQSRRDLVCRLLLEKKK